ncbi:MAG: RNA polymerase subunit sigma-70, partial [Bacteriovoracaceae bacterium]|nr:RNA polymerase subunit sigma-70 [Bacteriovoracaceae bacterium]
MENNHRQPYEVSLYTKRVNEYRYLTLEEELDLARKYREGDIEAGKTLVNANLRNVVKAGRPFFYQGYNPLEIIQEGNLGLMRALPLF